MKSTYVSYLCIRKSNVRSTRLTSAKDSSLVTAILVAYKNNMTSATRDARHAYNESSLLRNNAVIHHNSALLHRLLYKSATRTVTLSSAPQLSGFICMPTQSLAGSLNQSRFKFLYWRTKPRNFVEHPPSEITLSKHKCEEHITTLEADR